MYKLLIAPLIFLFCRNKRGYNVVKVGISVKKL